MILLKRSLTIKSITLTNRIVMPPMTTSKSENGKITKELIDYYDEKSKGGNIGLIITEHLYVSKDGIAGHGQISISDDTDIEGLKKIASVIHKNGSKVIAQISHAGSSASIDITKCESISASAIVNVGLTGKIGQIPREMSQDDIQRVVKDFADASKRAKEAGFDGIEIHSAHAYLLDQFYSPLGNKRTDEYGKTLDGRIKIHLEIIKAIRKTVGEDFIIALRLGACDYMDGGSTIEDGVYVSKEFEKAGVDLLDISGGFNGYLRKDTKEPGWFGDASSAIKKEVSIPVILTGGVTNAKEAELLLQEEKADLIGVGRAILKDSNWSEKAVKGMFEQKAL